MKVYVLGQWKNGRWELQGVFSLMRIATAAAVPGDTLTEVGLDELLSRETIEGEWQTLGVDGIWR